MLSWDALKIRLLRGLREGSDGRCSVIVLMKSGQRISGKVGPDAPVNTWTTNEIHITNTNRNGTATHIIDLGEVAAVTVVGA